MDYEFTVRVHVENPDDLQREIAAHNELVDKGIATGIISDEPSEWDWDQMTLVWGEEMAGENAFDVTEGQAV